MAEHHRAQHHLFGEFLGFGFHHHHRVGVPATTRSSLEFGMSSICGIEHIFAVDEADARRPDRAHEGNAGNGQRRGGRDQGHDVGIVFQIVAENGDDHLRLVAIAVGEQRTDRAVDQARGQGLAFGRARLRA